MKDLFPRILSSVFYVLAIIVSIYYGLKSFIILLILFCVVIIIEYGKVLRKDMEHFEFIKYGSRYGLARKDRPVRQLIRIPKFSLFPQKIEVSHENWDQWQVP